MDIATTKPSLSAALSARTDYLISRQGVISGNIANASTPGYVTRDLDFDAAVNKERLKLATTSGAHVQGFAPNAQAGITYDKTHMRHDGNSVKMDVEMMKLSEIQMNHRMMTRLYSKHAQMQRMALGSAQ